MSSQNKAEIVRDHDARTKTKIGPKALAAILNTQHPDLNFTEQYVSTIRSKERMKAAKSGESPASPTPPVKTQKEDTPAAKTAVKSASAKVTKAPEKTKAAPKIRISERTVAYSDRTLNVEAALNQIRPVAELVKHCGSVEAAKRALDLYGSFSV